MVPFASAPQAQTNAQPLQQHQQQQQSSQDFPQRQTCIALFDSGCTGMVLGEQFAGSHKDIIFERPKIPLAASLADKCKVAINRIAAQVPVQAGPTMANYDFVVAPI
ncbi:hypothetical protein COEREDRAFT_11897 [Coemansia reversa NRRL 1564]|uniref:Uncharacterized protein n=1 Tax=Coemansia reversa (strain ATCC 12441 / NRRL 1564) TaxID=763665 RepID=A0A2G5B1V2_COERN|nr:hypothetical protein COEREDRAFT_11897 [Coemansia reversa NRRL 1564]|eukprot:PIA12985.1 hypothetical protein COEREDRAFT_11897 [Coemansia reversa NRRL 1564]